MKLQNMPVPLTAEMVDEYMGPILEAAKDGDLSRIKNVPSAGSGQAFNRYTLSEAEVLRTAPLKGSAASAEGQT
jgi:hypothetical protein